LLLVLSTSIAGFAQDRAVVKRTNPVYPEMAKRMRVSGTVVVKVIIAADGKVTNATAVSGHPLLKQAAVNAVKDWQYAAGAEETRTVEINFRAE
jgi:TonB family protein